MKSNRLWILLSSAAMLSACTLGPDYKVPEFSFSSLFQQEANTEKMFPTTEIQEEWWQQFNDEMLNELVSATIRNNHDIRIAVANVEEARAVRDGARRDLFPDVFAHSSGTKSRSSGKTANNTSGGNTETDRFTTEGTFSWELDIFGKLRRQLEAENARIEAEEATKHGVMLTAIAEMAQSYFEVRGLQKRIAVTKHNIEVLKEVEQLANIQLKNGIGTQLEVSQAKGERQSFESRLPNLQAELKAGIYRISVLAGQAPEYYVKQLEEIKPMPSVPDVIPVGLRGDILRNRPDIAVAERSLAAENAEIGAAIADRFPELSLTGAVGSSARLFSDLFAGGAGTFSIGGALSWEIFDGNFAVEEQEAATRAALANYEKTILIALEEVESALIRYGSEWQTLKSLKAAEKTRQEGFRIAKLRYREGEENFLSILDAERSLVTAEDDVIQSEIFLLTRLTDLYKALGGGWQPFIYPLKTPVPTAKPQTSSQ